MTGMTGIAKMTGITLVTGMIWMSGTTCMIRMNRVTTNEMSWMAGKTGITGMTN